MCSFLIGKKTTFTCECPFGTKGDRCEIQSLNFPAQSYLVLHAFSTEMSFEFSTGLIYC